MVMGYPHFKKSLEYVLWASYEQSISFSHLVYSFSHPCPFSSLRARGPKSCCCLMEQIIMQLIKVAALFLGLCMKKKTWVFMNNRSADFHIRSKRLSSESVLKHLQPLYTPALSEAGENPFYFDRFFLKSTSVF